MKYDMFEKIFPRGGMFYKMSNYLHFKVVTWINWLINGHVFTKKRINGYLRENKVRKVQFGSADKTFKGFLNTGIPGKIHVDISRKLPFPDKSIDLIFDSHVIEHIHRDEFKRFLKETHRILKRKGVHIISTPSMERCARYMYCIKGREADILKQSLEKYSHEKVSSAFYLQGLSHLFYHHKFIYDLEEMTMLARRAGYKKVSVKFKGKYFGFEIEDYYKSLPEHIALQSEIFVLEK